MEGHTVKTFHRRETTVKGSVLCVLDFGDFDGAETVSLERDGTALRVWAR